MARKKPFKKQLKEPDQFITLSTKLINLLNKYRLQFAGAVLVLVVVVSGVALINYFAQKSEDKASVLLEKHMAQYRKTLQADKDLKKAFQAVNKDFIQLIDTYGNRQGGKLARVLFGNICYDAGEIDQAILNYNQALKGFKDNPSIINTIYNGLGYAYEKKQDYADSVKYFELIIQGPNALFKQGAFLNLGRIYAVMGEADKSRQAYQKVISEYPESRYLEFVKETI